MRARHITHRLCTDRIVVDGDAADFSFSCNGFSAYPRVHPIRGRPTPPHSARAAGDNDAEDTRENFFFIGTQFAQQ
jgi:hypothetical protein